MIYTFYGKPKVGKTTLALAGANPAKTILLNADQGLTGIDTTGITIIDDLSTENINKTVLNQAYMKKFDRVIIDTATSLYDAWLQEASGVKTPRLQDYGTVNNGLAGLLRSLRSSSKKIIVLGQERMVLPSDEWDSSDEDEEVTASVTMDLPSGASKTVMTMSDVIGRLYIAMNNDRPTRRLWLVPTPNIVAGARSSVYKGRPPYLKQPTVDRLDNLLGWNN